MRDRKLSTKTISVPLCRLLPLLQRLCSPHTTCQATMSASTSPTPEQWAAMSKLVQQFFNKPDAGKCGFVSIMLDGVNNTVAVWAGMRACTTAAWLASLLLTCRLHHFLFLSHSAVKHLTLARPTHYCLACLEPFREKVDYEALGLIDYPQIIKKPMDLGLIRKKLDAKQYKTLYEVADDVRLVWNNCMTYNADGSDFYLLAQSLAKKWQEKYSKLLQDFGLAAPPAPIKENSLTLEEKRTFAKNLYKLSKEDVGMVLVELDQKCPQAVIKNAAEDEYELNVDKITGPVFTELTAFINTAIAHNNKKKRALPTRNKRRRGECHEKGGE